MVPPGRVSRSLCLASCLLAVTASARLSSQQASPTGAQTPFGLVDELAARIASAAGTVNPVVLALPASRGPDAEASTLLADLPLRLASLGVRLVPEGENATRVWVRCSLTDRDRVCSAEIRTAQTRTVVAVSRPRSGSSTAPATASPMTIVLRPVYSQRDALLDVCELGPGRLLVLDADGVAIHRPAAGGSPAPVLTRRPIAHAVAWPRDLRGRLRVVGNVVEAFMPGLTCRGTLEPLAVECAEGRTAWPIGVDNEGMAAGSNHFTSRTLPPFFSASPVETKAGSASLVATLDGPRLAARATVGPAEGVPAEIDDVAGVTTGCGGGHQVLIGTLAATAAEQRLQAFEWRDGRLVPAAPPAVLAGRLTALWSAPGGSTALAIVHHLAADRYEAYEVGIACGR